MEVFFWQGVTLIVLNVMLFVVHRKRKHKYIGILTVDVLFVWSMFHSPLQRTMITTSPWVHQTSGCGQPSDGRQSDSVSTCASLHEAWRSAHTCCVSSQGSCPWVTPQFLYLPTPAKNIKQTNNNWHLKWFGITRVVVNHIP